jgi:hypothetical protein
MVSIFPNDSVDGDGNVVGSVVVVGGGGGGILRYGKNVCQFFCKSVRSGKCDFTIGCGTSIDGRFIDGSGGGIFLFDTGDGNVCKIRDLIIESKANLPMN